LNRRKQDVLAWESRFSLPTGLLTFVAVIILIVSAIVIAGVNGSHEFELLEAAKEHASSVTIS
jgi:NADH:ubiquinone oxidoreductase subunit H